MESAIHVLVTGASGFVGSHLTRALARDGLSVTAASRSSVDGVQSFFSVSSLDGDTDWGEVVIGQDVVIHCAARVHVMGDQAVDPLASFRAVNVEGTVNLCRQAAIAGVKRFIFISSIKVNGERTRPGAAFFHNDVRSPEDPYGISKAEAEVALKELAVETGMELVIIRPPLIYGPGVKGNFASLLNLVGKGLPLPLGAVNNVRSLVALDNLVDLIVRCVSHPKAAGEVFLVSDGEPVSTTALLREIALTMGKRSLLLPVPEWLFRAGLGLIGKKAVADRLFGSLVVDITHTKKTLGWEPPVSFGEGIRRAVER